MMRHAWHVLPHVWPACSRPDVDNLAVLRGEELDVRLGQGLPNLSQGSREEDRGEKLSPRTRLIKGRWLDGMDGINQTDHVDLP